MVLGVVAIIAIVALSGGDDDDPSADERHRARRPRTHQRRHRRRRPPRRSRPTRRSRCRAAATRYQFPNDDWKDLTADTPDTTGTIDTIAAPGDSIGTARGNILVETSSAFGETDVNNLKDDWKTVLQGSTGGTPVDLESTTIGGKEAVGVEIKWTNANDFDVHQIAYLVISGDEQYSITASFAQGDSGFKDTYYAVLDTWVWEE